MSELVSCRRATEAGDALLCVQLPLDVSSPLVLGEEAAKRDSRWLAALDWNWKVVINPLS